MSAEDLPAVEVAARTDPGRDPSKQVNEDSSGYRETRFGHLAVVCDGMGGHAGGREASELALATIFDVFDRADAGASPSEVLRSAIVEANRRVYTMEELAPDEGRPGSTVVAILLHAHGTEVAHVGDSRCYLVHEAQVFQITKDHSMVQRLIDAQMLSPADAAAHPDANKILRALGTQADVDVELRPQPLRHVAGDLFVLCSDGLSDLVESDDILRAAGTAGVAQAAGQLVNLANARGGHDNITVLLVRVRTSARTQPTKVALTVAEGPSAAAMGLREAPAGAHPVAHPAAPPAGARATVPLAAPLPPPAAATVHAQAQPSRQTARTKVDTADGTDHGLARKGLSPGLLAGLALALVGLGIALAAAYLLHRERGGREHPKGPAFDLESLEAGAGPAPTAVELTPAPPRLNEGTDTADDADAPPLPSLAPAHPPRGPRPRK